MTDHRQASPTPGSAGDIETFGFLLQRGNGSMLLHLLFAFFGAFTLYLAIVHVPWRDEAQPWLFARDLDLSGMFYVARHNGHPMTWFVCAKILQELGAGYLSLMVLDWAFGLWGVWLLFYRSYLPLAARLAFAYAPICFSEIVVRGRNYAFALPICFLAAYLYQDVQRRPIRFSIVLALLASTNVYAAAVFVGLWFQFLLEQAFGFGAERFSLRPVFTRYLVANLILAVGAIWLFLQLAPIHFPGDPFPSVTSHLYFVAGRLVDLRLTLVLLPWLCLPFLPKVPSVPRILGTIPTLLLAAIPIIAYSAWGRHLYMLGLGVVYFCWIYYDNLLKADWWLTRKWGPFGVAFAVTLLIFFAGWTPKPYLRHAYPGWDDGRNAAYAVIDNHFDRPDTVLVSTDPFKTMTLLPYFRSIQSDYAPAMFGPSPQSYAYDAYVGCVTLTPSVAELKPLVLDVAQKNPGKTILIIGTRPRSADIPDYGPGYQLQLVYRTPLNIGPLDEGYEVYLLRQP
jgi:hypothetical protein